jgi:hypothetical protein
MYIHIICLTCVSRGALHEQNRCDSSALSVQSTNIMVSYSQLKSFTKTVETLVMLLSDVL